MREPASREVPLMASVGLLLDRAVLSAGAARRTGELGINSRGPLEELLRMVDGAAELETAPLGIFQASAVQSPSDMERLEALEDTRPPSGFAWRTLQAQLQVVLSGDFTTDQAAELRVALVGLAEASLARSSAMAQWRPRVEDEWTDLEPNSSFVH